MDRQLYTGQEVTLIAFGGPIVRRVVEVLGDVVVVGRDEELERAAKEGRAPLLVGFRMKDVLEIRA